MKMGGCAIARLGFSPRLRGFDGSPPPEIILRCFEGVCHMRALEKDQGSSPPSHKVGYGRVCVSCALEKDQGS